MQPTEASFRGRPIPGWYDDAKLGIFVHWGITAVPGWAPTPGRLWDVPDPFANNPYAEWYWNSMRIQGSPTARHHAETWGADFDYREFAPIFQRNLAHWRPAEWADVFARAGARYVVLVTKHHDGFLLWPSAHRNPKAPDYVAGRDVVGELAEAVRARGLRFGTYYSGGIDWLWHPTVVRTIGDLARAIPRDPAYLAYATAHWQELADRYRPCSMWNDIGFPASLEEIEALQAHYYERVPDGVVNDRFRMTVTPEGLRPAAPHDVTTPEYQDVPEIRAKKWEAVRGIGNSFGWNRAETAAHYLSERELVHLLVDTVSKNGNLLLNVGPNDVGAIPELQRDRVLALGRWLAVNGEAIHGTRPWTRAEGRTRDGAAVRFTRRGSTLYAIVLDPPAGREIALDDLPPGVASLRLVGSDERPGWKLDGASLRVALPPRLPAEHALALALELAP
jgi:alpha-L-fucosidase